MRFERLNTCAECGECKDGHRCNTVRQKLGRYDGIRFTSDGFDCALPVAIDSHSVCSYGCLYCFADNTIGHRATRERPVKQTPLGKVERLFSRGGGKELNLYREALKYGRRNENGYPCPVQLGAINEPCDNIERQQGWLLEFIKIAIKYQQPVRISTKGTLLAMPEYLGAISEAPQLFWVAFSIISPDDELLEKVDRRAPNATKRLETMAALSRVGVKTSLRFRPMFPGLSDSTPRYPKAYRTLIEKAAEAGAVAISYEVGFVPGGPTKDLRWRWDRFSNIVGMPWIEIYKKFGGTMACMRPPYIWTENIMHAVYEEAHKNGLVCGVSDPVWKQLTDTGCCCGILPDDPVFGNWEEESATNQLLIAKKTSKELGPDDIIPPWAHKAKSDMLYNPGAGPLVRHKRKHETWAAKMRRIWNNLESQRGPLNYFQGALQPTRRDAEGNIYYRYVGLKRTHPEKVALWKV